MLVRETSRRQQSVDVLDYLRQRGIGHSASGAKSALEHRYTVTEVAQSGFGPGNEKEDNLAISMGEEMVPRQAVQLTEGINRPRDGHDTGETETNRIGSSGETPGTEGGTKRTKYSVLVRPRVMETLL